MGEIQLEVLVAQSEIQKIDQHRREIAWHKKELDRLEKDAVHLLLAGATLEPGRFTAKVAFRCMHVVSWKNLVIRELGQPFADKEWKESRLVKIPQLKIVEHPPLELWNTADNS